MTGIKENMIGPTEIDETQNTQLPKMDIDVISKTSEINVLVKDESMEED